MGTPVRKTPDNDSDVTDQQNLPLLVLYLNDNGASAVRLNQFVSEYTRVLTMKLGKVYNVLVFPVRNQKTELVIMPNTKNPIKVEEDLVQKLEDLIN